MTTIKRGDHITPLSDGRELERVTRTRDDFLELYSLARSIQESSIDGICVELSDGTLIAGVAQSIYLHRHLQTEIIWFDMTVWPVDRDGPPMHFDSRHVVRLEKVSPARAETAVSSS